MTFEQTKEQFLLAYNSNAYLNMCESEDMHNAIVAIEKQIPKTPTPQIVKGGKRLIGKGWWCEGTTIYRCPCCGEFISRTYDYCYKCGQKIDWSDTE